jgi:hypothetical protein
MMVNGSLQTWLIEAGIVRIAPVSDNSNLDLSHQKPNLVLLCEWRRLIAREFHRGKRTINTPSSDSVAVKAPDNVLTHSTQYPSTSTVHFFLAPQRVPSFEGMYLA